MQGPDVLRYVHASLFVGSLLASPELPDWGAGSLLVTQGPYLLK